MCADPTAWIGILATISSNGKTLSNGFFKKDLAR